MVQCRDENIKDFLMMIPWFILTFIRYFIMIYIVLMILRGPITDSYNDSKELIQIFYCSVKLTISLTSEKVKLFTKPLNMTAFLQIKNVSDEIGKTVHLLIDSFQPLHEEIFGGKFEIEKFNYIKSKILNESENENVEIDASVENDTDELKSKIYINSTNVKLLEKNWNSTMEYNEINSFNESYYQQENIVQSDPIKYYLQKNKFRCE
ncbi:hypothetical protein A3Q56_07996, partial [Intoshia linei]